MKYGQKVPLSEIEPFLAEKRQVTEREDEIRRELDSLNVDEVMRYEILGGSIEVSRMAFGIIASSIAKKEFSVYYGAHFLYVHRTE